MKYFDIDTGLEVQLTEEEKISLASQCSFANRYPIKQDLLDRMSDLSIEGGALYRFKIDPGAIQNELEHAGHEHASIELPEGFSTELAVIRSAVRAGLITRALVPGGDPDRINDDTRILKDSFLAWVRQQELAVLAKDAPQAAPAMQNGVSSPWTIKNQNDPEPEQDWYIAARHFARQLVIDDSTLLTKKKLLAKKIAASLKGVGIYKRGGKLPFADSTILKALVKVTLR